MRELSLLKRARARELKEEGQMLDGVVADAASGTASRRLRLSPTRHAAHGPIRPRGAVLRSVVMAACFGGAIGFAPCGAVNCAARRAPRRGGGAICQDTYEWVAGSAEISFRQRGPAEPVIPDVALTRSVDRSTGTATFRFERPRVLELDDIPRNGLITGLWLRDDEGELTTEDVKADFVKGRPRGVTAVLILKSSTEWSRFMRFMKRYSEANGLAFESADQ